RGSVATMNIRELRILPPLAIGRLGAARTPMDNYEAKVDPQNPLASRTLIPTATLLIDERTGAVRRCRVPRSVRFKEDGKVRPVAPFLEVWARVGSGDLVPLTSKLLEDSGASLRDVAWKVIV